MLAPDAAQHYDYDKLSIHYFIANTLSVNRTLEWPKGWEMVLLYILDVNMIKTHCIRDFKIPHYIHFY